MTEAHCAAAGGTVPMPMQHMVGGDYFGSLHDKIGICWMIDCSRKS